MRLHRFAHFVFVQEDEQWYLGFVNNASDAAAKLLTRYKHDELAYFKSLVREHMLGLLKTQALSIESEHSL